MAWTLTDVWSDLQENKQTFIFERWLPGQGGGLYLTHVTYIDGSSKHVAHV